MDITVVDPSNAEPVEAAVPQTMRTGRITGRLIDFLELPVTDGAGHSVDYELAILASGTTLPADATLEQAGVSDGDVLTLRPRG